MSLFSFLSPRAFIPRGQEPKRHTGKHAPQQVIAALAPLEQVLQKRLLPPEPLQLVLKEVEEVRVVFLLAEALLGLAPVDQALGQVVVLLQGVALVVIVDFVGLIERWGLGAAAVEGKEVVDDLAV